MITQQAHDPVTAPSHYRVYPTQPIDITRHLGFCLGNAVKYVLRAPHKNGAEDLRKALQYLEWEEANPAPAIAVRAYREAEKAIGAIVDHLTGPRSAMKDLQSQFLILLDDYLATADYQILWTLHECVQDMLNHEEGK